MRVNLPRAIKPVSKLRKLLNGLPRNPVPAEVHELRTQARKVEAVLHALSPGSRKESHRILKIIKPVRRAAGRVRDMDVLIAKASSLSARVSSDRIVRLVEQMSEVRAAEVNRLYRIVKRRRKRARPLLKDCLRNLQRTHEEESPNVPSGPVPGPALAVELERWPEIRKGNLHEFRKGVKKALYMLQLSPDHADQKRDALARVKDTAGDWHDWLELERVAESLLDSEDDAAMLREIRKTLREKLSVALSAANALRHRSIKAALAA